MSRYDLIIVGAGSAGCVLANRLSCDRSRRVLLVEAGPRDWNPFIHMPAGLAALGKDPHVDWRYGTEPEPKLDNRRLWWPRGRVLGGSSSINAMCYVRGEPADYDGWARAAADPRWAWHNVLPYFKRAEDNSRGADALHGIGGPLAVSDLRYHSELSDAFIAAAIAAGYPRNDDFNGNTHAGFGLYQVTQRRGARCSTATGYLRAIRRRRNLEVRTRTRCLRVLIDRERAVGVELGTRDGAERVEAGEVVLAGGTINSPQLLMLSGVGPADHLREQGIDVALDLPGVGTNLCDHLDACTLVHSRQPVSYDHCNEVAVALRYLVTRSGIGTSNIAEAGGFVRTRYAPDNRCDVQFHFLPALLDDHGRRRLPGYGYTLHACALKPCSRGRIRLRSGDPLARPAIFAGYLSDPEGHDLATLTKGVRLSREILAQHPFDAYRGDEIFPGTDARDNSALEAFIRRKAETIYHPVGTCRMGAGPDAVVDGELRVRGLAGLRVVDASVMPELPSGNTNAPTIMIAEVAADLIRGMPRPV